MKKLIILFLAAALALAACSPKPDKNDGNKTGSDLLQDFKSHIAAAEDPSDVKEYLDRLMKNTGGKASASDALVLEYLNYMEGILAGNQTYSAEVLKRAGFKMVSTEGFENPVIDYHFIDAYSDQISPELSDFSRFMALNSDEPWAMDGGIVISLERLADRIALAEQFMVKYPDFQRKDMAALQYEYYLKSFLGGLDNTPLVSYDTGKINPEFIEAFGYYLETYPSLATAATVESLRSELERADYKAPYSYGEDEKRNAFGKHIDELVSDALDRINQ